MYYNKSTKRRQVLVYNNATNTYSTIESVSFCAKLFNVSVDTIRDRMRTTQRLKKDFTLYMGDLV